MHNLILKNFLKQKNKLKGGNYNISDIYLYDLLSNKNIHDSQKIKGFILNLFLNFFSFITIIKCKTLGVKKVNYIVATENNPTKLDFRSKKIINNIKLSESLNLIRNKGFISSIILYFKYPNVIFYSGIESLFINFKEKKNFTLVERYLEYHKILLKIQIFFEKLFLFLFVKKILMIDDQRIYPLFLDIARRNQIETYGYMHYKFSKYVVSTYNYQFDNILVWSDYFKKKLIKINPKYKNKNFYYSSIVTKKNEIFNTKKRGLLYIFDLDFDFKVFKKINDCLDKSKYKLFLKFKPQNHINNEYQKFCNHNNIIFFKNENLDYILNNYEISFFVAPISSLLLESTLYNCVPIKIKTANDFFDDTISDKVVKVLNPNKISKINQFLDNIIKNRHQIINTINKKVWSVNEININKNIETFCKKFNS